MPIVIVGIDEPSFADLEQAWPWPRSFHAELVGQLDAAGAAVIAFDIVFADPSLAANDQAFAIAIQRADNVVLAGDVAYQQHELFEQVIRIDPLGMFLEAGATTGVSSTAVDMDLVVRSLPQADEAFWRQIVRVWNRDPDAGPAGNPDLPVGSLIRYLPPEDPFSYASYYQALDPGRMLPPGFFQDKIVLVGLKLKAAAELGSTRSDMFATPYYTVSGWLSPGVEVVAMEVANGLMDRSVMQAAPWVPVVALFTALLIAAGSRRDWQPLVSGTVALALIAGLAILSLGLFAWRDYWLPVAAPVLAILLYYLARGASAYLSERNRRRAVRRAFEHYVSPNVVAEILTHPELLELGGTRRKLTLMFTDLAGFTSHAEHMQPEQVSELLNEHFGAMASIVIAHGGTIDKFIGDAVMAFWGAPLRDEEQALHACQAGVAMQQEMERLRQSFRARGFPEIRMRIGIHTGQAIVGNMGASERFDYTAVGDTVNLASRIEGVNKLYGTSILITRDVFDELDGLLPLWPIDKIRVKGKSLPMQIYTLNNNEIVGSRIASALDCFHQRNWQAALEKWQTLAGESECRQIAEIYIERIERFLQDPPAEDWDGSFALDKM